MIGNNEKGSTTNEGGEIKVTGLSPLTKYQNVRVRAYDNAGNYKDTFGITVTTLKGIDKPVITVLDNGTWSQTKTAQIEGITGYTIKYTLDGTNPTASTTNTLTGTGTQNIAMDRENCKVRAVYVNNATNQISDVGISEEGKIDRTGPSISLSVSSYDTYIIASWSATDSKSGLSSTPYRYKIDYESSYSSWTSSTSVTKSDVVNGINGKSGYFYVEVSDSLGNTNSTYRSYSTKGTSVIAGLPTCFKLLQGTTHQIIYYTTKSGDPYGTAKNVSTTFTVNKTCNAIATWDHSAGKTRVNIYWEEPSLIITMANGSVKDTGSPETGIYGATFLTGNFEATTNTYAFVQKRYDLQIS